MLVYQDFPCDAGMVKSHLQNGGTAECQKTTRNWKNVFHRLILPLNS